MTVRPVPDFVEIGIEGAGRDFMQQRLPDVGAMTVDEEDVDVGVAPVSASQFRGELQPPGASPDDDDLRHFFRHVDSVDCSVFPMAMTIPRNLPITDTLSSTFHPRRLTAPRTRWRRQGEGDLDGLHLFAGGDRLGQLIPITAREGRGSRTWGRWRG